MQARHEPRLPILLWQLRWATRAAFVGSVGLASGLIGLECREWLRQAPEKTHQWGAWEWKLDSLNTNRRTLSLYGLDLKGPRFNFKGTELDLQLNPWAFREGGPFFALKGGDLWLKLLPAPKSTKATPPFTGLDLAWPDLPFALDLQFKSLELWTPGQKQAWIIRQFHAQNPTHQSLALKGQLMGGPKLPLALTLQVQVHAQAKWTRDSLHLWLGLKQGADTVRATAHWGRKGLYQLPWDAEVSTPDPMRWIAFKGGSLPLPHHVFLQASGRTQLPQGRTYISAQARAQTDAWVLFPALNWQVQAWGEGLKWNWDLFAQQRGGPAQIALRGSNSGAQVQTSLNAKNWTWNLAHHPMPMDVQNGKVRLNGTQITADLITADGSKIHGTGDLADVFFDVQADITESERWVYAWTGPSMQLQNAQLSAQMRFHPSEPWWIKGWIDTKVKDAWGASADRVRADVLVDQDHLEFNQGQIEHAGAPLSFAGDVAWDGGTTRVHTQLEHPEDRTIQFFWSSEGNLSANASRFPLADLPFASLRPLALENKLEATLSWSHLNLDSGSGWAQIWGMRNGYPFGAGAKLSLLPQGLSADTLWGDALGSNFRGTALWDWRQASLGLQSLRLLRMDSLDIRAEGIGKLTGQRMSGLAYGGFAWTWPTGDSLPTLNSDISIYDFSLRDSLGRTLVHVPGAKLTNDQNWQSQDSAWQVRFQAKIEAGLQAEYQGDLDFRAKNLFDPRLGFSGPQPKLYLGYHTPEGGVMALNMQARNADTLDGTATISGPWNLPVQGAELLNSNLNAKFSWSIAQGMQGLDASLSGIPKVGDYILDTTLPPQLTIAYTNLPVQQIRLAGRYQNFLLDAKLLLSDTTKNSLDVDAKFDLTEKRRGSFWARSQRYALNIGPDQDVSIHNLDIRQKPEAKYDLFSIQGDSALYSYFSPTVGRIRAVVQPELNYIIPLQRGALPKIEGNLWLQKAVFEQEYPTGWNLYRKILGALGSVGASAFSFWKSSPGEATFAASLAQKKPVLLDMHLRDERADTLMVATNLFSFPLEANLNIQGTSTNPTLTGRVAMTEEGKLFTTPNDTPFVIRQASVEWNKAAPLAGRLLFDADREIAQCVRSESSPDQDSLCQIGLNARGSLEKPKIGTTSDCSDGREFQANKLVSTLVIGCVTEDEQLDAGRIGLKLGNSLLSMGLTEIGRKYSKSLISKINVQNLEKLTQSSTLRGFGDDRDSVQLTVTTAIPGVSSRRGSLHFGYTESAVNQNDPATTQSQYFFSGIRWNLYDKKIDGDSTRFYERSFLEAAVLSKSQGGSTEERDNADATYRLGWGFEQKFWNIWHFCLWGIGNCSKD